MTVRTEVLVETSIPTRKRVMRKIEVRQLRQVIQALAVR